jgi:hypothetical protein
MNVSPHLHTITIFTADGNEESFHLGTVGDPVTGLAGDLAKVFS